MAFKATRNMPFSLVLQKLSSFYASSEICAIRGLLHSNYWIRYSVIYEPNEFQIPASACSSILHFPTASKSKRKEQNKNYSSVSLLLFWKYCLLIYMPLWTLPTFFLKKNRKRLENKTNVKKRKKCDQNKKNVKKRFLHLLNQMGESTVKCRTGKRRLKYRRKCVNETTSTKGLSRAHELNWTELEFANSSINSHIGIHRERKRADNYNKWHNQFIF